MRNTRMIAALVLSLSCVLGAAACGQETDASPETPQEMSAHEGTATAAEALDEGGGQSAGGLTAEALQGLGDESPMPGPGVLLPGGPDVGGPGYGWGSGFASDPDYAQYFGSHDPDPYKEQRHAKQREYARISAENRHHYSPPSHNYWSDWVNALVQRAERAAEERDAPEPTCYLRAPRLPGDGPLNDKARCMDACWEKYIEDSNECRKYPTKDLRRKCLTLADDALTLCNRDCSRKYPGK